MVPAALCLRQTKTPDFITALQRASAHTLLSAEMREQSEEKSALKECHEKEQHLAKTAGRNRWQRRGKKRSK